MPRIDQDLNTLYAIPGAPPPLARPSGCPFHPRCDQRFDRCGRDLPALLPVGLSRVACHLLDGHQHDGHQHDGKGA